MAATRGSVALADKLRNNRPLRRKLVGICDVSEQTTRNWESGACEPKEKKRPLIEDVVGIPRSWWDEAPIETLATGTEG